MNVIAAVDNHWAIGYQGSLLVRIPSDQKMFREMTEGKVIVMGRKTLETSTEAATQKPYQYRSFKKCGIYGQGCFGGSFHQRTYGGTQKI